MQQVYHVQSDNFIGYIFELAYRELTLQMSTGDYSTHQATKLEKMERPELDARIYDLYDSGTTIDESHWTVGEYVSKALNMEKASKGQRRTICKARIYRFELRSVQPIDARERMIRLQLEREGAMGLVIKLDSRRKSAA